MKFSLKDVSAISTVHGMLSALSTQPSTAAFHYKSPLLLASALCLGIQGCAIPFSSPQDEPSAESSTNQVEVGKVDQSQPTIVYSFDEDEKDDSEPVVKEQASTSEDDKAKEAQAKKQEELQKARLETERLEKERLEKQRLEAARKAESERIAAEQLAEERRVQAALEKAAQEKAVQERAAMEKADREARAQEALAAQTLQQQEREKAAKAKEAARKAELARQEQLRQQQLKQEQLKQEQLKQQELDKAKQRQIELARQAELAAIAKKAEAQRALAAKREKERLNKQRIEQERLAKQQLEKQQLAKQEAERLAKIKAQKEEAERIAAAKAQAGVAGAATPQIVLSPKPSPQISGDRMDYTKVIGKFVSVPSGKFKMGDLTGRGRSSEKPVRSVEVNSFYIMEHEVPYKAWDACVKGGGCSYSPPNDIHGRGQQPVSYVSYNDIVNQFIPWLKKETGIDFRLPSEAEWEYAARAGSQSDFSWGDKLACDQSRYNAPGCGQAGAAAVKSYLPNAFGLYNVNGNLWEWTQDCWKGNYRGAPANQSPRSQASCTRRSVRGGSWFHAKGQLRTASRVKAAMRERYFNVGFRLVMDR